MPYKPGQQIMASIISSLSPDEYIKTSIIAKNADISLFSARYYLRELHAQGIVERDCAGQGKTIRWRLMSQFGRREDDEA